MTFNLGGNDVTINSNKIWMEVGSYYRKICILTVGPSSYDFWILGDAFIRDFYVILDYDEGKVEMYGDFG